METTLTLTQLTLPNVKPDVIPYGSRKKLYLLPEGMNRPVTSHHIHELAQSIKLMGVVRSVILVKLSFLEDEERTYILDGQHLREACNAEKVDMPVVYLDSKHITSRKHVIEIVAKLNNTSRPWKLIDYVSAWAKCPETKTVYSTLMKWKSAYPNLGYSSLQQIAMPYVYGMTTKVLKGGDVKIADRQFSETLLDNISQLYAKLNGGYTSERKVIIVAYIKFYINATKRTTTNYNHGKFLNLFVAHKAKLNQYMHSVDQCCAFFEEVYKGGKVERVIILQRAGSPKSQTELIKK